MDITSYLLGKQAGGGGGGGDTPSKGIIFSEWDNDGYPTKAEVVGLTALPNYYFRQQNGSQNFVGKLQTIILPNDLTSIGFGCFEYMTFSQIILPNSITTMFANAFAYCANLTSIILPSSLTTMGNNGFYYCSNLESVTLPTNLIQINDSVFYGCSKLETINLDNVQTIMGSAFRSCYALKKICLPSIKSVSGNGSTSNSFAFCSGLKQVWIGENVTTTGLQRYAFNNCTALEKIYINLPRATVEAMTGYSYAFCNDTNKVGIIVCNDDSGFITKEEFNALVIN